MKFQYQGSDYDLKEIVGEKNISRAEHGDNMIISKDGMTLLLSKFPDIDCTFGELESFQLKGQDCLAVQACAFNRNDSTLPIGRSYGELNARNADDFAMQYPVSTVENRGRNRAVLRHLGITGLFSEEELAQITRSTKPEMPSEQKGSVAAKASKNELQLKVKELCKKLGWSDDKKLKLYCHVLGIDKTTPVTEIKERLTTETIQKAIDIAETKLKA